MASPDVPDDAHAAGATVEPGDLRQVADALGHQLGKIERLLAKGGEEVAKGAESVLVPAWREITEGEPRWPVSIAIVAAVAMQLSLPSEFTIAGRFLLPVLEVALMVGLVAGNPTRIRRSTPLLRGMSISLIALISLANAVSAVRLVRAIVQGTASGDPTILLGTGASIWATNVLVFALWYWDLDRGGPAARALQLRPYPDFLFPQMTTPELVPSRWAPTYVDYLYLSFTNATAFSPTDVLPLARWAKLAMLLQSAVSLVTVGLVIARAVNILR